MSNWRDGYHAAILEFINSSTLTGSYNPAVEAVSIEEEIDYGFRGSEYTAPDDPEICVTVKYRTSRGSLSEWDYYGTLTSLIRNIT